HGGDERADGGRDGSLDRSLGRRAHRLRHGEGDRQVDGDRGREAPREDRRRRLDGAVPAGRVVKAAVLTVSDGVFAGEREDKSGDALEELLAADGYDVSRRVVPDEREQIWRAIRDLAAEARLVLTTGGTGVAPRDVTPEATLGAIDRQVPGLAEAIRAESIAKTPHALLSRG